MTKYLIMAFGVFVLIAGGYFYYAQNRMENLAAESAALRAAVEIQTQTIETMIAKQDAVQKVLEEFNLSIVDLETRAIDRTKETVRIIERARTEPTIQSGQELTNNINDKFSILEELSSGQNK